MTSFPTTDFWSEIDDRDAVIPRGKLEYFRERLRNDLYDFVARKFLEEREKRGLSQSELARRLSRDPASINRLLGAPGNWTVATVSDLLLGICGETLLPQSVGIRGTQRRNMGASDLLNSGSLVVVVSRDLTSSSTARDEATTTTSLRR